MSANRCCYLMSSPLFWQIFVVINLIDSQIAIADTSVTHAGTGTVLNSTSRSLNFGFSDTKNDYSGGAYYPGNHPLDIIAILDGSKRGILVTTGDDNYALVSENLLKIGWSGVSVNGNQVIVNTVEKKRFTTNINTLNIKQRKVLLTLRQIHLTSLAGLDQVKNIPTSISDASHLSNPGTNIEAAASYQNDNGYETHYRKRQYNSIPYPPPPPPPQYPPATSGYDYNQASYGLATTNTVPAATIAPTTTTTTTTNNGDYSSSNYEQPSSQTGYNYYNLGKGGVAQLLGHHLIGDVYSFNREGYVVDVFSSTATVNQKTGQSILYRDHNSFSYAKQNMPLSINRFFLTPMDSVIFVYNDSTILVKPSSLLNPIELELVLGARSIIKDTTKRLLAAAEIAKQNSLVSTVHLPTVVVSEVEPKLTITTKPHEPTSDSGTSIHLPPTSSPLKDIKGFRVLPQLDSVVEGASTEREALLAELKEKKDEPVVVESPITEIFTD